MELVKEYLVEKLIRKIKDEASAKYDLRRIELRSELEDEENKVVFAHEICQCKMKSRFERLYPELKNIIGLRPPVMIGELIEKAIKNYLKMNGKEFRKKIGNYILIGSPDLYDEENNIVYDIKYTTGSPIPKEHHELRVAVYKFLADSDDGRLIYISPKGFKEYVVEMSLDENQILELIESKKSPRWAWECENCVYNVFCNIFRGGEVNGRVKKTLDSWSNKS